MCPIEEEEIISHSSISPDKVDRKKFLLAVIKSVEKRKFGSGRKLLHLTGFKSLDELE